MQCISLLSLGGKYLKMMAFDISFLLPSMAWKCFGAGLQALKHDMTSGTSCRNVISIENTARAVFVVDEFYAAELKTFDYNVFIN